MSKKPKLSPWYPASVKPARVGFYEVRQTMQIGRAFWTGYAWKMPPPLCSMSDLWGDEWRGLAEKPQ